MGDPSELDNTGWSLRDEFFFVNDHPRGPHLEAFLHSPTVGYVYPPFLGIAERAGFEV